MKDIITISGTANQGMTKFLVFKSLKEYQEDIVKRFHNDMRFNWGRKRPQSCRDRYYSFEAIDRENAQTAEVVNIETEDVHEPPIEQDLNNKVLMEMRGRFKYLDNKLKDLQKKKGKSKYD